MSKKINIAIDGHSSCGKSTLAKALAKSLGYIYIDSGAMYRAVALYFIDNNVSYDNSAAVEKALGHIEIEFKYPNNNFTIFLNGQDVTQRIIHIDVSQIVSEVAAISIVRKKLVELQQRQGINRGVVMDGRDIGTVVFPAAELKLFVTASIAIRTERRFLELQSKGMPTSKSVVQENLNHRDNIDSTRVDSPLRQAEDAILIDNSYMDREEQLFMTMKMAAEIIDKQ